MKMNIIMQIKPKNLKNRGMTRPKQEDDREDEENDECESENKESLDDDEHKYVSK